MKLCMNYRKNNVYKIVDIISNESYIFLDILVEQIEPIIQKIEKESFARLTEAEITLLQNYYGNNIIKLINTKEKINFVKFSLNEEDTILTIKKKILVAIYDIQNKYYIPLGHQHLWIDNNKLNFNELNNIRKRIIYEHKDYTLADIKTLYPNFSFNSSIADSTIITEKNINLVNINNSYTILGYKYVNTNGDKLLDPNPLNFSEDNKLLFDDILSVQNSFTLKSYHNANNIIYLVDYAKLSKPTLLQKNPKLLEDTKFLWPYIDIDIDFSESEDKYISYKTIIDELINIQSKYNKILFNINIKNILNNSKLSKEISNKLTSSYQTPDTIHLFNSCKVSNIIMQANKHLSININLYDIFKKLELNYNIPFIKLKDESKNNLFRIYPKLINNNEKKIVKKDFKNYDNYINPYSIHKYKGIISKKILLNWKTNKVSYRENLNIKDMMATDHMYTKNLLPELSIKFLRYNHHELVEENKYGTLLIHHNGFIEIKILNLDKTDTYTNWSNINKNLEIVRSIVNKINKLCYNQIPNISKTLTKEFNLNIISLDSQSSIMLPKIKISKLESILKEFYPYVYITKSESRNIINLKYKNINKFESFLSIKSYFYRLKKKSTLNITDFKNVWIEQTKRLFNMSELESINILDEFGETYDSEDAKNIIELETDIQIVKQESYVPDSPDLYFININNCNNLKEIQNIHNLLSVIFFIFYTPDAKKPTSPKVKKKLPEIELATTNKKYVDDSNIGLDDNFSDLDFSDDESEGEGDGDAKLDELTESQFLEQEDEQDESSASESEEDVELLPGKQSIRTYMVEMRKEKDKKLHFFSTKLPQYSPFSIKCGAVDMRQPFILSKTELANFRAKNPTAFDELKILEWGSSKKSKNFYICPRIWCIRDKIALTDKQLIDNDGKCPFCQGEIIDPQIKEIKSNKTIIIRRAGSNNYWADEYTKDKYKKTPAWKNFLQKTEKDAYPSFLIPDRHPNNLCMPCCNSNPEGNYDKCMITNIDLATTGNKIDINQDLVIGGEIDGVTLNENTTVLVKNQSGTESKDSRYYLTGKPSNFNNIFIVTKSTPKIKKKFTNIDIDLDNKMIFHITNGIENKLTKWRIIISSRGYQFDKETKTDTEDKYILGPDKFPLGHKKLGLLSPTLDKLFKNNIHSKMSSGGKPKSNVKMFLRRGVKPDINSSFLSSIASLKEFNCYQLIRLIITNLDPITFASLNEGDLVKQFTPKKLYTDSNIYTFIKWCKQYNSVLTQFNKPDLSNVRSIDEMKELLKQTIVIIIYRIFISYENFKLYCGDFNIPKNPEHFIDLLSRQNDWFYSTGLNIIVLERITNDSDEQINMVCNTTILSTHTPTSIIIKYKGFYEPIVYVTTSIKYDILKVFTQSNIKSLEHYNIIKSLINIININCRENIDAHIKTKYDAIQHQLFTEIDTVIDILSKMSTEFNPKSQIIDSYSKSIGILTNNNTIVYSKPFGLSKEYPITRLSEIDLIPVKDMIEYLNEISSVQPLNYNKPHKLVKKGDMIVGVLTQSGTILPIQYEKFIPKKYDLPSIDLNYNVGMKDQINLNKNIRNERINSLNDYNKYQIVYEHLRYELSKFFQKKDKKIIKLKNYLREIIENPIINVYKKRDIIKPTITKIITNLVLPVTKINRTKKMKNKNCQNIATKKCDKTIKCGLNQVNQFKLNIDEEEFTIYIGKCKIKIEKTNIESYINMFIEELVRSYIKRNEILDDIKNLSIDIDDDVKGIVISDDTYEEEIEQFYNIKKNIYLSQEYAYSRLNPIYFDETLNLAPDAKTKKPLKKIKQLKTRIIVATSTSLDGKDWSSKPNIKGGPCKFPFKYRTKSGVIESYKCVPSGKTEKGYWCATSLKQNGYYRTYGFCPKDTMSANNIKIANAITPKKSNIYAGTIDSNGTDFSKGKHLSSYKSGQCIFPFKYKGNYVDKCIPFTKKKGSWCATSLYDTPPQKRHYYKTIGICQQSKPNHISISKKADKSKAKPMKLKIQPPPNTPQSNNSKEIYGDIYNHRNRIKTSSQVKAGKCIFPYSYKKRKHYECYPGKTGNWCPTSVNTDGTVKTWAYCLSKGKLPKKFTKKKLRIISNQVVKPNSLPDPVSVSSSDEPDNIYGDIYNNKNVSKKTKRIVAGKCIFPYKYNKKLHTTCYPGKTGNWCPTSLKDDGTVNTYAYCLPKGQQPKTKKSLKIRLPKYNVWIAEYMSNNDYNIVETVVQGDCFFDCIRLATKISIKDQRTQLSKHITQDIFDTYKLLFTNARINLVTDPKDTKSKDIYREFDFIESIDTLLDLQKFVLTNDFWANSWAIAFIEKYYNIKVLIFSEEYWDNGDVDKIIKCGHYIGDIDETTRCSICDITHKELSLKDLHQTIILKTIDRHKEVGIAEHQWVDPDNNRTSFNPKGYIMVSYSGNHYKLITYKGKSFLKFSDLPDAVVELFKHYCMSTEIGTYHRIPDFK